MHTANIYIRINTDLSRSYITKPEATTQHLETRQWVK
jgi:hypothetical protein